MNYFLLALLLFSLCKAAVPQASTSHRKVLIMPGIGCVGGSEQECRDAQNQICAKEKAPANLILARANRIEGLVYDPSGALIASTAENIYQVQLRNVPEGKVLQSSPLDKVGYFSFDQTLAGALRLIVVSMIKGIPSRFGFLQSGKMSCEGNEVCNVKVVLPLGRTDQAENPCPPK